VLRWLRRVAYVLAALLIASAAYIATIYFFGSEDARGHLALIYAAVVANHHPPPIAATGVVSAGTDWMMPEPASTKFTAILRRNFPLGSDEHAMRAALVSQGFRDEKIADCGEGRGAIVPQNSKRRCQSREPAQSLRYDWGGAPCDMRLTVHWTADRQSRLVAIEGHYGAVCL
jgi:hypothetical protein